MMLKKKYRLVLLTILLMVVVSCSNRKNNSSSNTIDIAEHFEKGFFEVANKNNATAILCSSTDFSGVNKIASVFASDIERVCGKKPDIQFDTIPRVDRLIIIGTLGNNLWIDSLANQNKIDKKLIEGKWETSLIQVVKNPFKGIKEALVIAGSDKRGTIFGMFDCSEKMGVSPWYWWADVPVKTKESIYINPGVYLLGEPAIKYRGIFINDEAPALTNWVYATYGEFTSDFYYQVFELILRLKGNYLWPAMWGKTFNFSDTLNPVLADELGIVMGTSHHEPMLRAQQEWKLFGKGPWNYEKNQAVLEQFWREGIQNMKDHESIVTIGMRGDGDEPMTEESNIALLQKIVANQRQMIEEVTKNPASEQPQIWALYKEVQAYYDKGMRVPDDITLLLCDDNWGNVRKLPNEEELKHPGGYGMYYHYDYVGDPRNYKWLNTNSIPRIWEQMNLTYSHGVDKIWIVNVGDIKPMELPITFFLDYAWNPDNWPLEKLPDYTTYWSEKQFGPELAKDIACLLDTYTRFNALRTPEMLSPETYSLINYREFETVVTEYNNLAEKAVSVSKKLDKKYYDAFYQLVEFPIKASANLNELYYTVALNRLYASQNRVLTNTLAENAKKLYEKDSLLTHYYNNTLNNGKWKHMMDQTHIGYTYWQQPDFNVMPALEYRNPLPEAKMGVALEGSKEVWPGSPLKASMPEFSPHSQSSYYIEIFNQGNKAFACTLQCDDEYIQLPESPITITDQTRIEITVDWNLAPEGRSNSLLYLQSQNNETVIVTIPVFNPIDTEIKDLAIANGYVSIEAENYTNIHNSDEIQWQVIPGLGRTLSGIKTFPANHPTITITHESPYLEYNFHAFDTGWVEIHALFSPTLDYKNQGGLNFGLAFNDESIQLINMHKQPTSREWGQWVGDHIIETVCKHYISNAGMQSLKYYAKDAGVVLQKIVIDQGGLRASYLGAPSFVGWK